MDSHEPTEISVVELKKRLDQGESVMLVDVREPFELEICRLNYTFHIPMADLRFKLDDLDPFKDQEVVIYCRTGRRSAMAVMFLRECGFDKAKNLTGGVHAWSDQIDSSFTKY